MEQLEKYTLYVGLNDKDTKKQEVKTEDAMKLVSNIVGDNTMQIVHGHYTHADGHKVNETTLKIELLFKNDNDVRLYCNDIKRLLNQESIAVNKEISMSALI
jgi:hypothetical protein